MPKYEHIIKIYNLKPLRYHVSQNCKATFSLRFQRFGLITSTPLTINLSACSFEVLSMIVLVGDVGSMLHNSPCNLVCLCSTLLLGYHCFFLSHIQLNYTTLAMQILPENHGDFYCKRHMKLESIAYRVIGHNLNSD